MQLNFYVCINLSLDNRKQSNTSRIMALLVDLKRAIVTRSADVRSMYAVRSLCSQSL